MNGGGFKNRPHYSSVIIFDEVLARKSGISMPG
jgi:hypothetical protein